MNFLGENPQVLLLTMLIASFAASIFLLKWLLQSRLSQLVVDRPNERSLHTIAVPRSGGLAIMAATLISWGVINPSWIMPFIACAIFLVVLSFMDDVRSLSAGWRCFLHFVVAAAFVAFALPSSPLWMTVVSVVAIVWMTNLFNFMDGADGFAGGMALFGFGAYAVAAWLAGDHILSVASAVIAAASGAFLIYNFHPARIFMGDGGSIPLGFFAAAIGLYGWESNVWPFWFPVLVFSVFIVDATVTLLRRIFRGERVWQAHRSHYYQRLVQMGWGHRKTALRGYGVMLLAGASGIWLIKQPFSIILIGLGIWIGVFSLGMIVIDSMWKRSLG